MATRTGVAREHGDSIRSAAVVLRVGARGLLPYRLRFTTEIVAAERPARIEMALSGDFEGSGAWHLEPVEAGTRAVLDWRPVVRRPLVRNLTPALRPLFRANHTWTMRRGERHIAEHLASRVTPAG